MMICPDSHRNPTLKNTSGFTLMEVLVALLILSSSIYILLGHHYAIMNLQESVSNELIYNQLAENAVALAELGIVSDRLSDAGDFGERFEGYYWSYDAILQSGDDLIPLYAIQVTIDSPTDSRTYELFYYHTGNPESMDGDGGSRNDRLSGDRGNDGAESGRSSARSSRDDDRGSSRSSRNSSSSNSRGTSRFGGLGGRR